MLPNGLFGHLYGPIEGHHNDMSALAESHLVDKCTLHARLPTAVGNGGGTGGGDEASTETHSLYLFGDPAYGLDEQIISPFPKLG